MCPVPIKVMFDISPISRAWILTMLRPFFVALVVLMGVSSLLLTTQMILRAPFVPTPSGVLRMWSALLPETFAMLAPAALLLAVVLCSRQWVESGDMLALSTSGVGGRVLVRPTLLLGLCVALVVAFCTHVLAPMGRSSAREVLVGAAQDANFRSGQMVEIGDVWIRVASQKPDAYGDVTVIGDGWIAVAPKAIREPSGSVRLVHGRAQDFELKWKMEFDSASIALRATGPGIHNFERSHGQMQKRIAQMESRGKSAARERLTLYKRSTLSLIVPMLAVVGLPLGVHWRRPYLTTIVVVLLIWSLQRLCDHGAAAWGPELMAVLPLVTVVFVVALLHMRWLRR